MKISKVIFSLILGIAMLTTQVGSVLAAPAIQEGDQVGEVTGLTCGTNGTTVIVTYYDENSDPQEQVIEVSMETAITFGFLPEGTETCEETLLTGVGEQVNPADLIPVEEGSQHPVGAVLATFFDFVSYDAVMEAHANGTGFGVIAQALWMTDKLEGDSDLFLAIVQAKKDGDYSSLSVYFDGDSTPTNWGQFKKTILNGDKKNNLGVVMSDKDNQEDKTNNGRGQDKDKTNNGKGQDKDKKKD